MTRQELLDSYDVNEYGIITSPGKFEAEMLYVPYYWDVADDVLDWSDETTTYVVTIYADDRLMFPEIGADVVALHMQESDTGFVWCEALNAVQYEQLLAENEADVNDDAEAECGEDE